MGFWTDELTEQVKKLWLEGISAGDIAMRLGGGATRNSVLGKLHRMKLLGPRAGTPKSGAKPGNAGPRDAIERKKAGIAVRGKSDRRNSMPRPSSVGTKARRAEIRPKAKPFFFGNGPISDTALEADLGALNQNAWQPLPGSSPLAIVDHRDECRWPIGEVGQPEFGFCGLETADGKVYCTAHTLRSVDRRHLAPQPKTPPRQKSGALTPTAYV